MQSGQISCSFWVYTIETCGLIVGTSAADTTAIGQGSIAIGEYNQTPYVSSGAIGRVLKTGCLAQFATGYANTAEENHAFEIGNGEYTYNFSEDADEYERDETLTSNAFAVTWDGDLEMALDVNAAASTVDGRLYAAIQALGIENEVIV